MSPLSLSPLVSGLVIIISLGASLQAQQSSPYRLKNGDEIKLSGKVSQAKAKTFSLDYGKGSITVELDDYDSYEEGFNIVDGDQVIVTGRVDADPGQTRTIEARQVYIPAIDLRIDASAVDEEDIESKVFTKSLKNGTEVELRGIIKSIGSRVFTIQSSKGRIEVHLGPLKRKERKIFRVGQAVKVTGEFRNRLFRKDMIFANKVEFVKRLP